MKRRANNAAITAHKESITKWRRNYDARQLGDIKLAATDCALCGVYRSKEPHGRDNCGACPVANSGESREFCDNTPYGEVVRLVYDEYNVHGKDDDDVVPVYIRNAIKEELDFLESLLPKN